MFRFSEIVEMQGESKNDTENISDGKEMTENINKTRSETKLDSVEDPLNMNRTTSIEKTLTSKVPNIIDEGNVITSPGQEKSLISILSDEFFEEQAFSYLLPWGKFGFSAPRNISISPAQYFNQRLLHFNLYFAS